MIGTEESPSLHAKAAESHGLLLFIRHLLSKHLEAFQHLPQATSRKAKFLLESSKAAVGLDEVFATESRTLSREQTQTAMGHYARFLSFYNKAGGPTTPKCHFMFHLLQRSIFKGNPRKYSTYKDESVNGQLAKIARSCHRRTWHNAIHWKAQCLHEENFKRVLKSQLFENDCVAASEV